MIKDLYYLLGLGYEYLLSSKKCYFFVKVKNCDKDTINNLRYWTVKFDKIETIGKYTYFYSFDKDLNNYMSSNKDSFLSIIQTDEDILLEFLRGFLENCGIYCYKIKEIPPILSLTVPLNYKYILSIIKDKFSLEEIYQNKKKCFLNFEKYNQYDFLTKIYSKLDKEKNFYSKRMLNYYNYVRKYKNNYKEILYKLNDENAKPPYKLRGSDSGYDLTIIKKIKQIGNIEFFDTCLSIQPPPGYYFDLVPRSSLSKTGYILANNIGIIDQSYTGNIIVPLIKIDNSFPDIDLPFRAVQIIPRRILHFHTVEIKDMIKTDRAKKGFGSSGLK